MLRQEDNELICRFAGETSGIGIDTALAMKPRDAAV